ncbi:MAG: nucleoid-associated protein [Alistipes sp.]|nr:nucleoid-associated protein [Alistipes sp.]
MLFKEYIDIESLILHQIGSYSCQEDIRYSKELINVDQTLKELLKNHFLSPFKFDEYSNFSHSSDIRLNEIYQYATQIFSNKKDFLEVSKKIALYLYECSSHPNIKRGELYVVYLINCILNGETIDAIGLFKSETKDKFLKIYTTSKGFGIEENEGVSINKVDKGCLIFNTEKENGYLVAIVDNTNKGSEAKYWTDDFLHVRPRKDSFNQTQNMLSLCKSFVSQLPNDNGKVEKATYMNRSVEALKEESVNINTFAEQVFETPKLVSEFKQYKETFQKEWEIEIDDTFATASTAIKRRATSTMTTIKLDKNFDINIHGGEQYIVRGYDEERGMYYYQLFFKEEK